MMWLLHPVMAMTKNCRGRKWTFAAQQSASHFRAVEGSVVMSGLRSTHGAEAGRAIHPLGLKPDA